jgi:hypothetical protein
VSVQEEKRLGLAHRVLAAHRGLKEYAVLVTDKRSVFIQLPQSRNSFMLRTEIVSGSSGRTTVQPKKLEDYSKWAIGSLESEAQNFSIAHASVTKLIVGIGGFFPVYHFNFSYRGDERTESQVFYAVPLETYEPAGQQRPREVVLREYAESVFSLYQRVLPASIIEDAGLGQKKKS